MVVSDCPDAIIEVSKSVYGTLCSTLISSYTSDLLFIVDPSNENEASYGTRAELETTEKVGLIDQ